MHWLAVALGGALGATLRYAISMAIPPVPNKFPYATFTANLVGSFLMGILFVIVIERAMLHPLWRQFATIGFLGALTTFSTFSLEVVNLFYQGHWKMAALYAGLSVSACVIATYSGYLLIQKVY